MSAPKEYVYMTVDVDQDNMTQTVRDYTVVSVANPNKRKNEVAHRTRKPSKKMKTKPSLTIADECVVDPLTGHKRYSGHPASSFEAATLEEVESVLYDMTKELRERHESDWMVNEKEAEAKQAQEAAEEEATALAELELQRQVKKEMLLAIDGKGNFPAWDETSKNVLCILILETISGARNSIKDHTSRLRSLREAYNTGTTTSQQDPTQLVTFDKEVLTCFDSMQSRLLDIGSTLDDCVKTSLDVFTKY